MTHDLHHETAVMISDIHVGDPQTPELEDFDRDEDLARLLLDVIPERVGMPTTLIIGGDFIDFPQILPELGHHDLGDLLGTTQGESLQRMQRAIAGHPRVFAAIGEFIGRGGHVRLLAGNHDVDFHWPQVLDAFRAAVGNPEDSAFRFVRANKIHERGVYIEHGNQYSYDNRFTHWDHPIIEAPDGPRLERPWGTLFMDVVYNDAEIMYPFANKVYPHSRLAAIGLRSFVHGGVSARLVARFLAFFAGKGKRFAWERLLGAPPSGAEVVTPQAMLQSIAPDVPEPRRNAILSALDAVAQGPGSGPEAEGALLGAAHSADNGATPVAASGLLGRDIEEGLADRARELLQYGGAQIVAFGHTHEPVDGNEAPLFGASDPRRWFNTGSWIPRIIIADGDNPSWDELTQRPTTHDLRYLVLRFGNPPTATLETLPSSV